MRVDLPVTKPGIYAEIKMDDYHSQRVAPGPSISSSGLRRIWAASPAHFYAGWDGNPSRAERKESEAFILGRAAHHLLLGEDAFSTIFIARPVEIDGAPWQGNRTVCKRWLADQAEAGRTVLLPSQLEAIKGMARSLARHPLVQAGILSGDIERSMVWRDTETGAWCKARPDAIPNDSGDFADLKTTTDVTDDALSRALGDYAYHQQGAFIGEGWQAITGNRMSSFSLVFVEKDEPWCVRVITLKDCDLERGARQNRVGLRRFAACLKAGEWPGPGKADAEYLELAPWSQKNIDFHLEVAKASGEL